MTTLRTYPTHSIKPAAPWVLAMTTTALLVGCGQGSKGAHSIPSTGVAAAIQIDLPRTGQTAHVAATVYKDGAAQALVGGDVIQARAGNAVATLQAAENMSGHYAGSVMVDHADTPVDIAVNYDNQASNEQRWFASDDLTVKPGPGSLVGYAVTGVQFPPEIYFSAPTTGLVFHSLDDALEIHWDPLAQGHNVHLTAAVSCVTGRVPFQYGLSVDLGQEDGSSTGTYATTMASLVSVLPLAVAFNQFVDYIALYVTEQILGRNGGVISQAGLPPATTDELNHCDIDLTLIREQENTLPAAFSGGYAISSRSDTVRIQYVQQ